LQSVNIPGQLIASRGYIRRHSHHPLLHGENVCNMLICASSRISYTPNAVHRQRIAYTMLCVSCDRSSIVTPLPPSRDQMDRKPDVSGLGLQHGAIAGQSPNGVTQSAGGFQQGTLYDLDYGVANAGEQLSVSAALPTGGDGGFLTTGRNISPGSSAAAQASAGTDKKHMCAICGDRASGKHYGVHR
jgi:hypothetical protein